MKTLRKLIDVLSLIGLFSFNSILGQTSQVEAHLNQTIEEIAQFNTMIQWVDTMAQDEIIHFFSVVLAPKAKNIRTAFRELARISFQLGQDIMADEFEQIFFLALEQVADHGRTNFYNWGKTFSDQASLSYGKADNGKAEALQYQYLDNTQTTSEILSQLEELSLLSKKYQESMAKQNAHLHGYDQYHMNYNLEASSTLDIQMSSLSEKVLIEMLKNKVK